MNLIAVLLVASLLANIVLLRLLTDSRGKFNACSKAYMTLKSSKHELKLRQATYIMDHLLYIGQLLNLHRRQGFSTDPGLHAEFKWKSEIDRLNAIEE